MATPARSKRMPQEDRRAAILEAAAQVFFEQGYAATSIDAIIERIGGSKRNIYNEFGNKEGLFTALITESADTALAALSVERFAGRNLSEVLLEFGRRLMAIYMSPALDRRLSLDHDGGTALSRFGEGILRQGTGPCFRPPRRSAGRSKGPR